MLYRYLVVGASRGGVCKYLEKSARNVKLYVSSHHSNYPLLGDKAGARLTYCGKFEVYRGDTLETIQPEYDIPDMRLREDEDFLKCIDTGVKNKNNIDNILETMRLLDALYASAEKKGEITL